MPGPVDTGVSRDARPDAPRKWLYLPIETKPREFDAKALLAFAAAERGWTAILGSSRTLTAYCGAQPARAPRGLFIGTGVSPGHCQAYQAIQDAGSRLVSWCEEGLIYGTAEEYGRLKIERASYDRLDAFFAWGPNQADDLAALGCDREKVIVSGNPRFDLLRPELRAVFAARADAIRQRHGPFILVNTKFNKFNHYFGEGFYVKRLRGEGLLPTPATDAHVTGLVEYQRAMMRTFVDAIHALSARFPERRIIVRPHPSEDHQPWRDATADLANVDVLFDGNVVDWILAATATVHNNCTTGVEAYLVGRPSIAYRPLRDARFDVVLPHALSEEATDIDTLCRLIQQRERGAAMDEDGGDERRRAIARRYIAGADGPMACDTILDALDAIDLPREPPPSAFIAGSDAGADEIDAAARSLPAIEREWGDARIRRYESYMRQKCSDLSDAELLSFRAALNAVTGRFAALDVRRLHGDLLCVSPGAAGRDVRDDGGTSA